MVVVRTYNQNNINYKSHTGLYIFILLFYYTLNNHKKQEKRKGKIKRFKRNDTRTEKLYTWIFRNFKNK